MRVRLPAIGLPLLTKELVEQSARKRTYIVRVGYACLLFASAFLMFYELFSHRGNSPFEVLGRGREMFEVIVVLEMVGIYLFMPAITCSTITLEKERNSLSLLMLTKLGPATIIFEKLLGRLFPMVSFLLLSLPLLAFTYSLGGISPAYLWSGIWLLAVTAFQIGALSILCSAFFRTTVGSFVGSYICGAILLFGPVIVMATIDEFFFDLHLGRGADLGDFGKFGTKYGLFSHMEDLAFCTFAPYIFLETARNAEFKLILTRSIPMLSSAVLFLVTARVVFVPRAFAQPKQLLLRFFRSLDRAFKWANEKFTGGIELVKDSGRLPGDEPIAWRETTKTSLGTFRYLVRVLLAIEIPVVVICVLIASVEQSGALEGASVTLIILWILAVLMVSVKATSLISAERSRETLDVLLTTPVTAREILKQKFRGVQRLIVVMWIPMLTIILFEAFWMVTVGGSYYGNYGYNRRESGLGVYLVCSLLTLVIYLPMVAYVSFLIGLLVKSQARAIIAALAIIVGWCTLPFLALIPFAIAANPGYQSGFNFLLLFSPATIVPVNEFREMNMFAETPWVAVMMNFFIYGTILIAVRLFCLLNADRHLGRGEDW